MRKLYSILVALILAVMMITTAVVPVMAEPAGNHPVAWVNLTGAGAGGESNPGNDPTNVLPIAQVNVKRLADGSTVGHMKLRFLAVSKDTWWREWDFEVVDSYFIRPGVAEVLASNPMLGTVCWYIEDNGEPGGGIDAFAVYMNYTDFYAKPLPTDWDPEDQSLVPFVTYQTIAPDNIQVHITEDY